MGPGDTEVSEVYTYGGSPSGGGPCGLVKLYESLVMADVAKSVFTKDELVILMAGLLAYQAQVERALAKEQDPVVVEARKKRLSEIRAIINRDLFN